eukprot:gene1663-2871_t
MGPRATAPGPRWPLCPTIIPSYAGACCAKPSYVGQPPCHSILQYAILCSTPARLNPGDIHAPARFLAKFGLDNTDGGIGMQTSNPMKPAPSLPASPSVSPCAPACPARAPPPPAHKPRYECHPVHTQQIDCISHKLKQNQLRTLLHSIRFLLRVPLLVANVVTIVYFLILS